MKQQFKWPFLSLLSFYLITFRLTLLSEQWIKHKSMKLTRSINQFVSWSSFYVITFRLTVLIEPNSPCNWNDLKMNRWNELTGKWRSNNPQWNSDFCLNWTQLATSTTVNVVLLARQQLATNCPQPKRRWRGDRSVAGRIFILKITSSSYSVVFRIK